MERRDDITNEAQPPRTGVLTRIRARIARLGSDRKGVAAIEFAFAAPVLLLVYFMTMEVSQSLEVNKKTGRIAIIVGDLVTQQQTVTKSEIDAIMKIGEAVVQPYNRSKPSVYVTGIKISDEDSPKAKVVWSRKLVAGVGGSHLAKNTTVTIPPKLMIKGSFLVRAEAELDYKPVVLWGGDGASDLGITSSFSNIEMHDEYYLRPRMSHEVPCGDC